MSQHLDKSYAAQDRLQDGCLKFPYLLDCWPTDCSLAVNAKQL